MMAWKNPKSLLVGILQSPHISSKKYSPKNFRLVFPPLSVDFLYAFNSFQISTAVQTAVILFFTAQCQVRIPVIFLRFVLFHYQQKACSARWDLFRFCPENLLDFLLYLSFHIHSSLDSDPCLVSSSALSLPWNSHDLESSKPLRCSTMRVS